MSLGKLLNLVYDNKVDTADWYQKDKTIVTICNIGKRAEIAARELARYCGMLAVCVLACAAMASEWCAAMPGADLTCGAFSNGYTATFITRGMVEWTKVGATKPDL
eukprot:1112318-Rhodomonas_salina.1